MPDDGQITLHKNCPPFTITGKFSDYPHAIVTETNKFGKVISGGHVVYEDDEWIVLRPKGTVQYEIRKTPTVVITR